MNSEQLNAKIAELEKQIAELKHEAELKSKSKDFGDWFFPEKGDVCFQTDIFDKAYKCWWPYIHPAELPRLRSTEAAERYAKARLIEAKFRKLVPWEPIENGKQQFGYIMDEPVWWSYRYNDKYGVFAGAVHSDEDVIKYAVETVGEERIKWAIPILAKHDHGLPDPEEGE